MRCAESAGVQGSGQGSSMRGFICWLFGRREGGKGRLKGVGLFSCWVGEHRKGGGLVGLEVIGFR